MDGRSVGTRAGEKLSVLRATESGPVCSTKVGTPTWIDENEPYSSELRRMHDVDIECWLPEQ